MFTYLVGMYWGEISNIFINIGNDIMVLIINGHVAQRITRLPTEQKIAGSNPAVIKYFFKFLKKRFEKRMLDVVFLTNFNMILWPNIIKKNY